MRPAGPCSHLCLQQCWVRRRDLLVGADKTLPLTAPKLILVTAWLAVLVLAWNWLLETGTLT